METPSGKKVEPTITSLPDEPGKYEIAYVPEETGPHKLNVKYGKDHVKDSPFRLKVAPGGDASKVKVSGEGIEKPRVGQLVDIIFDTTEAGQGGESLLPFIPFVFLLSSFIPYTAKNATGLLHVVNVNFTSLLQFVNKFQQPCQLHQVTTSLLIKIDQATGICRSGIVG